MTTVKPIYTPDSSHAAFQASDADIEGAMAYEQIFVPALFDFWPKHLITAAGIARGDRILDIACGTGVLTRQLWSDGYRDPAPVGLDISPGMLTVASRLEHDIQWHQGDAVTLPFDDGVFERVFCQYGLMFFSDRVAAIREMQRVLVQDGRLVMAVWDSLQQNPGFLEKIAILDRVAGRQAGDALRAPFCLGDRFELAELMAEAGVQGVEIKSVRGEAHFRNLAEFVNAEVRGWLPVMGVHLSEDLISAIHAECRKCLRHYESEIDGTLTLPMSAHIAVASPGPEHS